MNLSDRLRRAGIHMAWLNTGGVQGYNPAAHASAMLEMLGVPYVGHDPLTASTLDNKHAFKREALCAGLPTAPFTTWHMARGPFRPELNSRFQLAFGDYAGSLRGQAGVRSRVAPCSCGGRPRGAARRGCRGLPRDREPRADREIPGRTRVLHRRGGAGDGAQAAARARGRDPFTFAAVERLLSSDERIFTSMDVRPITSDRCVALDGERDASGARPVAPARLRGVPRVQSQLAGSPRRAQRREGASSTSSRPIPSRISRNRRTASPV